MLINIAKESHEEARELRALFEKQLRELYWAENAMVTSIAQILREATSPDLVAALEKHTLQTHTHVSRLERLFAVIGLEPEAVQYDAVKCLLSEAQSFIGQTRKGVVRDAGIISVLQKIKHYEIACYGTMRAYAIALRDEEAVSLLEETLAEEKEADHMLSGIAESHINIEAADKEI